MRKFVEYIVDSLLGVMFGKAIEDISADNIRFFVGGMLVGALILYRFVP